MFRDPLSTIDVRPDLPLRAGPPLWPSGLARLDDGILEVLAGDGLRVAVRDIVAIALEPALGAPPAARALPTARASTSSSAASGSRTPTTTRSRASSARCAARHDRRPKVWRETEPRRAGAVGDTPGDAGPQRADRRRPPALPRDRAARAGARRLDRPRRGRRRRRPRCARPQRLRPTSSCSTSACPDVSGLAVAEQLRGAASTSCSSRPTTPATSPSWPPPTAPRASWPRPTCPGPPSTTWSAGSVRTIIDVSGRTRGRAPTRRSCRRSPSASTGAWPPRGSRRPPTAARCACVACWTTARGPGARRLRAGDAGPPSCASARACRAACSRPPRRSG